MESKYALSDDINESNYTNNTAEIQTKSTDKKLDKLIFLYPAKYEPSTKSDFGSVIHCLPQPPSSIILVHLQHSIHIDNLFY